MFSYEAPYTTSFHLVGDTEMELYLHDRIRQRAYQLWNAGGRIDGQAEQHWLAAEREILAEMVPQVPVLDPTTIEERKRPRREHGTAQGSKKSSAINPKLRPVALRGLQR